MKRILHIQTHTPTSGNAAMRLHLELQKSGYDSRLLSLSADAEQEETIQHYGTAHKIKSFFWSKIHRYIFRHSPPSRGVFSVLLGSTDITKHTFFQSSDIIYIHWINGCFLSYKTLKKIIKSNKPIIFFMHDMWTFTGGCHHSFDCRDLEIGCPNCPHQKSKITRAAISFQAKQKQNLFNTTQNITFISPSKWLEEKARSSYICKNQTITTIPNIINSNQFCPIDKKCARKLLNLPLDQPIIAFGATSITNPYKGIEYLFKALDILYAKNDIKNLSLAVFGGGKQDEIRRNCPFPIHFLGRFRDDTSAAALYNAADVFVGPSKAESFGMVFLESILCGTPAVSFNIGGIPEIIHHKINGYLAEAFDINDLANGIHFCLKNKLPMLPPKDMHYELAIQKHAKIIESMTRERHPSNSQKAQK